MPKSLEKGSKIRSKKLPSGKVIKFRIVRKKGPRGGHTQALPR